MEIDIDKENNLFTLTINKETILENEPSLGIVVDKIEQFAKMYYLKEVEPKGVFGKLAKGFKS